MSGWDFLGEGVELAFELIVDLLDRSDKKDQQNAPPPPAPRAPPEDCA
ncbi:hypothetical protein [Sphingomonas sp. CFBP 13720]|nr:hypothetical protein [Sphingomonas sp. CFBP 13720]MBD8679617.1 hypothetical protein [Sphingomonas sp. CFBP 13720]